MSFGLWWTSWEKCWVLCPCLADKWSCECVLEDICWQYRYRCQSIESRSSESELCLVSCVVVVVVTVQFREWVRAESVERWGEESGVVGWLNWLNWKQLKATESSTSRDWVREIFYLALNKHVDHGVRKEKARWEKLKDVTRISLATGKQGMFRLPTARTFLREHDNRILLLHVLFRNTVSLFSSLQSVTNSLRTPTSWKQRNSTLHASFTFIFDFISGQLWQISAKGEQVLLIDRSLILLQVPLI